MSTPAVGRFGGVGILPFVAFAGSLYEYERRIGGILMVHQRSFDEKKE